MSQARKQIAIFPDVPREAPMTDKDGNMTDVWRLFFTQLILALQSNFKPEGIVVPSQTAANIAMLTGTIPIGSTSIANILYDSTNAQFKGNIAGTWKTFTLT